MLKDGKVQRIQSFAGWKLFALRLGIAVMLRSKRKGFVVICRLVFGVISEMIDYDGTRERSASAFA